MEPQLPQLDVYPARHQRRLTVFFRLLLLIPQLIVVWLLGIVTFFAAIAAWFAALVLGRLPEWRRATCPVTWPTPPGVVVAVPAGR